MTLFPASLRYALALAAATLALPASAHDGLHAMTAAAGFLHPLTGLDHLLAMLAIGIWAAQQRPPARVALVLAFPLLIAVGAWWGIGGGAFSGMELGLAGSVAVLGLLIAFAVSVPVASGAAVAGLFALMHGYVHGAELPAGASLLAYGLGFISSTVLLHVAGLGAGAWVNGLHGRAVRSAGAGIAVTGMAMLGLLALH